MACKWPAGRRDGGGGPGTAPQDSDGAGARGGGGAGTTETTGTARTGGWGRGRRGGVVRRTPPPQRHGVGSPLPLGGGRTSLLATAEGGGWARVRWGEAWNAGRQWNWAGKGNGPPGGRPGEDMPWMAFISICVRGVAEGGSKISFLHGWGDLGHRTGVVGAARPDGRHFHLFAFRKAVVSRKPEKFSSSNNTFWLCASRRALHCVFEQGISGPPGKTQVECAFSWPESALDGWSNPGRGERT